MPLVQDIRYERRIRKLSDVLSREVPEKVLSILHDVRTTIGEIDVSFANVDLAIVLETVESGKYELNGPVPIRIDLASAKDVTDAYRKYSEGGCQSCVNLRREIVDAQDATSGFYCKVSDPDFNKNAIGDQSGVRYEGFSPKISKHYENPCEDWKPKFSPTLDKLVELK